MKNHTLRWVLLLLLLTASLPVSAEESERRGWLGIYTETVKELPAPSLTPTPATCGLRISRVFPDSPAEEGGLRVDDIIVGLASMSFTCPADSVRNVYRQAYTGKLAGTPFPMTVLRRDGETWLPLDLPVVLGLRSEDRWPLMAERLQRGPLKHADAPDAATSWGLGQLTPGPFETLFPALTSDIQSDQDDLQMRLRKMHRHGDVFRADPVVLAHFAPEALPGLGHAISGSLLHCQDRGSAQTGALFLGENLGRSGRIIKDDDTVFFDPGSDRTGVLVMPESRLTPNTTEYFVAFVTAALDSARTHHEAAFAAWTDDDRAFAAQYIHGLTDILEKEIYIHFDDDRERYERNKRLIDLARKMDMEHLVRAQQFLFTLNGSKLRKVAATIFADSAEKEIIFEKTTPGGKIIVAGTGDDWHRQQDVAFLLDLGGNDFYTGNAGASNGWKTPVSVLVDLKGDDAYETTLDGQQGSGILGCGLLVDHEGDDQYIGIRWAQGVGYCGIGELQDLAGNDTYRGRTFCQGTALFGVGILTDTAGNDRYEGDAHVQGHGISGGFGAIVDAAGDDEYYAKGLYPTNYGDVGIFDSWSQGCGMGLRTVASGGVGVIVDGGGMDRMEAGNFSQGGGYYYGLGMVHALGADDDTYIGSRYNQGFSAHQAAGIFLEEGGNDRYRTRQGVAQGLAWDECVSVFIDSSGDDHYQGGSFFSQGAAAHNSICYFLDAAGVDTYDFTPGQAVISGNGYHGGTSLAIFWDQGMDLDIYNSTESGNNQLIQRTGHGFFIDGKTD